MKSPKVLFFVIVIAINLSNVFAEEQELFDSMAHKGFKWGSNLQDYSQLNCKFHRMAAAYYCNNKNDEMKFLSIDIWQYEYSMHVDNEFDQVYIRLNNRRDFDALKDRLIAELGKNYIGDLADQKETYKWSKNQLDIILRDNLYHREDKYSKYQKFLQINHRKYFNPRPYQSGSCTRNACNLNNDENCDENDIEILLKSLEQCNKPGNYIFNSDADLDNDGCITKKDKAIIENSIGQKGFTCAEFDRKKGGIKQ